MTDVRNPSSLARRLSDVTGSVRYLDSRLGNHLPRHAQPLRCPVTTFMERGGRCHDHPGSNPVHGRSGRPRRVAGRGHRGAPQGEVADDCAFEGAAFK